MKIFVFTKKNISILNFIIVFIILIFMIYIVIQNNNVFAVELNYNVIISDEFKNRIENLTSQKEKIAYLTFDDGPNKIVTQKVLDILKKEEVKEKFFVIGKHVEEYPEIIKREYEEGHYIANHGSVSYTHLFSFLYN